MRDCLQIYLGWKISLKQKENTGCLELLDYGKFSSEVNIDAYSKMIEVNIDACNKMIEVNIVASRENTGCLELLDYGKFNLEVNIDACSKMIEVKIERLSTDIS